ncbi:MAG: hypothetical protein WC476_11865 [Phycisphaerae bacterium]|jgi:hypothetical protein
MAATEKKQMWFHSSDDGVAPATGRRKMAASQGIYMPGTGCYVSTSGTVKITDTSDGTGDVWHGFLMDTITAQHAANDVVNVAFIDRKHKYCVFVETSDSDSAIAQTNVGNEYGLRVATGTGKIGYTTLDLGNANATVDVVDLLCNVEPNKFAVTDSPGIAIVRFIEANIAATKA